ncbi:MAG: NAD(P)-dependent oxidoreductase [Candidatus Spechtbacterales bacterium]|nr:NAD(P)-dependent oxidoreductase [Candidatus Spechtbacterales bacterium]
MKKIAITGAKGRIGTVLRRGLDGFDITSIDLPDIDVRNYDQLLGAVSDHDMLIHLAWKDMNFMNDTFDPNDLKMAANVYKAAAEAGVERVIMASSVHADNFYKKDIKALFSTDARPSPDSVYGAGKVFVEALGRYYSEKKGLEVICVRFGGVNLEDKPPQKPYEQYSHAYWETAVWFSNGDCVNLINACLKADSIPGNYTIIYGVSDNKNRVHDISNPFNWKPKDSAEDYQS